MQTKSWGEKQRKEHDNGKTLGYGIQLRGTQTSTKQILRKMEKQLGVKNTLFQEEAIN
jgi:hypothetical protein